MCYTERLPCKSVLKEFMGSLENPTKDIIIIINNVRGCTHAPPTNTSDFGGFLIDSPAKVLELTWGQNGLAIMHVSTLVNDENDGTTVGVNNSASLHNAEVANCMLINAIKVSEATLGGDNTHVAANDGPIGSLINQSIKLVESATVNTNRVVSWIGHSGRRPPGVGDPASR